LRPESPSGCWCGSSFELTRSSTTAQVAAVLKGATLPARYVVPLSSFSPSRGTRDELPHLTGVADFRSDVAR
jgi:hypothetical protein